MYGTPRITVLNDIYPERGGIGIGLQSAAGNLGTATMPVIAPGIAGWLMWQADIGFAIPAFIAVALGSWLVVPHRTSPAMRASDHAPL